MDRERYYQVHKSLCTPTASVESLLSLSLRAAASVTYLLAAAGGPMPQLPASLTRGVVQRGRVGERQEPKVVHRLLRALRPAEHPAVAVTLSFKCWAVTHRAAFMGTAAGLGCQCRLFSRLTTYTTYIPRIVITMVLRTYLPC